tara:strand:- start:1581 stop:1895 length:315 start_codon:yes stop_codon:yes gene_type:complete
MADVEFTIDDMVNTAANKKPNEFNAMFDAAMADKISDKIDQARQNVADEINGVEPEEVEVEVDVEDEEELEADAEAETETDDNEEVESDEDDETIHDGEGNEED